MLPQNFQVFNFFGSIYAQSSLPVNGNSTSLSIINLISENETLGGHVKPSDFSMIVGNLNSTKTTGLRIVQILQFINGSDSGSTIQMMPGSFFVKDSQRTSNPITRAYNSIFSGDCRPSFTSSGEVIAIGNVTLNKVSTCTIQRDLIAK